MSNEFTHLNDQGSSSTDKAEVYVPPYKELTADTFNLNTELLEQLNVAKKLIHDASYDLSIPLNQKAQVINSVSTIIGTFLRQQQDMYNLEQLRKMETTLLEVLKQFPDLQEPFLKAYEAALSA